MRLRRRGRGLGQPCSVRRQRDCTSAVRRGNRAKDWAIRSCTLTLVPRQVSAVNSLRAQAQITSSGLESGL